MSCNLCFFICSIRVTDLCCWGCAEGRMMSWVCLTWQIIQDSAAARHLWVFISISVSLCRTLGWYSPFHMELQKSLNTGTAFLYKLPCNNPPPSAVNLIFHSDHHGFSSARRRDVTEENVSMGGRGLPACGICLATESCSPR